MKISLLDLPSDKIYIKFDQKFHKKIFEAAISKAHSQAKLAVILENSNEKFAHDWKTIRQQEVSGWYNNYRFLRLDLAKFIIDFSECSSDLIEKNVVAIKGRTTSKPIYNPRFPIILDCKMSQLLGKLCGDGSIIDGNSYATTYYNKRSELIEEFKELIKEKIGDTKFYEDEINGVKNVRVSGLIGNIVTIFFGFRHSKKVPDCIEQSNRNIKNGFIRSIFDDEATISTNGEIRLKMRNRYFVKGVKKLLEAFEIKTSKIRKVPKTEDRYGKIAYYFTISGKKNLMIFYEKIGFTHPKKFKNLQNRLGNYKMNQYLKGEPQDLILNILKKKPRTAFQLAREIKRAKRTVSFHLKNLEKRNLIFYEKEKKKFTYEYI